MRESVYKLLQIL